MAVRSLLAAALLIGSSLLPAPVRAQQGDDSWLDDLEEDVEAELEQEAERPDGPDDDADVETVDAADDSWLDDLEDEVEDEDGDAVGPGEDDDDAALELPIMGVTTFSMTSTTLVEYLRDPELTATLERLPGEDTPRFAAFAREKLELAAQGEAIRLSARLDGLVVLRGADCNEAFGGLCALDHDFQVPERATLLWDPEDFELELGDSHAVFGRGIALSLRRVDVLGLDTAIRGAQAQYDANHLYAAVLGGWVNPQNFDPVDRSTFDNADKLGGVSFGARLGPDESFDVGAHTVTVWFDEVPPARLVYDRAHVLGWRVSAPGLFDGALELHGEANAMLREHESDDRERRAWGRAIYGSAQLTGEELTLLMQWKDYRNYLLAPTNSTAAQPWRVYSDSPQLERDTERFRGAHNSRGGSVEVGYAFRPGPWSATLTGIVYGHEDERAQTDPWDGILVTHGYATLRRQNEAVEADELAWSIEVTGGYRRETHLRTEEGFFEQGDLDWRVVHGEVDFTVAMEEHSFELRVEHRDERRLFLDYTEYVRGSATVTYSWEGALSISPILQWNTEKKDLETFWPGGEVRWEFTTGSHIRVFGGRNPGGRICSGGICRDVPPFEGVQGELVLRL